MHAFTRLVQEQMDKRGWRASELSRRSGVSKQVLSNVLNDSRDELTSRPSNETIDGLAAAFSLDRSVILVAIGEAMGLPVSEPVVVYDASRVPNDALVRELTRRLREDQEVVSAPGVTVEDQPARRRFAVVAGELAEDNEPSTAADGTFYDERAVANEDETLEEEGIAQLETP